MNCSNCLKRLKRDSYIKYVDDNGKIYYFCNAICLSEWKQKKERKEK